MTDHDTTIGRTAAISGDVTATKLEALPPTRAERLRALEAQFGATSTRAIHPRTGAVLLGLELESGDRIVGRGATTEAALTDLEARMADFRTQEG